MRTVALSILLFGFVMTADRVILLHLKSSFGTVEVEDFGGLHDIILYALLPHAMQSEFHYDHQSCNPWRNSAAGSPSTAARLGRTGSTTAASSCWS